MNIFYAIYNYSTTTLIYAFGLYALMGGVFGLIMYIHDSYDIANRPIVESLKPVYESPEQLYTKDKYNRFIAIFTSSDSDSESEEINLCNWNKNIDIVFYNRKECIEYFVDENTPVECAWRTRVLMESTPRGNVIMYYNAYKQGFAYFSDVYIPYSILNAIAMKYVMIYKCIDFFIDNQIVPEEYTSPLLKLTMDEDAAEYEKKQKANRVTDSTTSLPFAKLKKYTPYRISQDIRDVSLRPGNSVGSRNWCNRFVNMGKICNWSPLLKPPPRKSPLFDADDAKTEFDEIFENAHDKQKQALDYKSFRLLNLFSSNKKN